MVNKRSEHSRIGVTRACLCVQWGAAAVEYTCDTTHYRARMVGVDTEMRMACVGLRVNTYKKATV
jgi:hypothetical protein